MMTVNLITKISVFLLLLCVIGCSTKEKYKKDEQQILRTYNFEKSSTLDRTFDQGIGILSLKASSKNINSSFKDSIIIFNDEGLKFQEEIFFHNPQNPADLLSSIPPTEINHKKFEFEYERFGLPIISIQGALNIVEVIFHYDSNGLPSTGFAKFDGKRMDLILWKDFLVNKPLFFISEDDIHFYDSIDGQEIHVDLPKDLIRGQYIMRPIQSSGHWMKVKLSVPSDYCFSPQEKQIMEVWIKYLTDDLRPLVWYSVRGC